jgi:hypothetical protein
METVRSSETSVTFYQATRRQKVLFMWKCLYHGMEENGEEMEGRAGE